ncbi:MAG TPA: hypothetical protein VN934_10165 [Candidatus Tumulicola sp.]|nr:hypothetical protein [Candidatus Tumulicola sp.]
MRRSIIAIAAVLIAAALSLPASASESPYPHTPGRGDYVRFDGSIGGQKEAWAYFEQPWLEAWLRFTISAAGSPKAYVAEKSVLDAMADHVSVLSNGTSGAVEDTKRFQYLGREDFEVRVHVTSGKLKGAEVWTTASELVDASGKSYLKR